jgi:hypothetical protein
MLSILGNALPEDCCQIIKLSGLKMFPSENPHFGLPRGSQHHTSLNESLTFHSSTIKSACSKRQWHSASTVIWYTIWYDIYDMIWYDIFNCNCNSYQEKQTAGGAQRTAHLPQYVPSCMKLNLRVSRILHGYITLSCWGRMLKSKCIIKWHTSNLEQVIFKN